MSAALAETIPAAAPCGEARLRAVPIADWLLEERAENTTMIEILSAYAERLRGIGIPIDRCNINMPQLHAQLLARSIVWDSEQGARELDRQHGLERQSDYLDSPVRVIYEGGGPIRRRIEDPESEIDFPILRDLKPQGFTDYTVIPLKFSTGKINALGFATKRPGGFSQLDLDTVDATLPALGAVMELRHVRRTSSHLLDTYLGHNAGRRVLNGTIRRGEGEEIFAVLWFCDMRRFTELSERRPMAEVVEVLNRYFDVMGLAVERRGGEILKFIGDGMLAIFPCEEIADGRCDAADRAIAASEAALKGLDKLNKELIAEGKDSVDCGIALHVGEVLYGNVGAADRLDFTAIGPAVNKVCRLESLCKQEDARIILSQDLIRRSHRLGHQFQDIGCHPLKGIEGLQQAYTLIETAKR
ncbi:MAG: adenylate/guanylate cyclase domain-containing protein [Rhodovibrionaceae bacterium]